jgi:hypothetical protein
LKSWNASRFRGFLLVLANEAGFPLGDPKMDRRDRELLDKQLRHLQTTPRNDGVMALALLTVFFTGMAVGGFAYAYTGAPVQIAATQAVPNQRLASNEVPIFVPRATTRQ